MTFPSPDYACGSCLYEQEGRCHRYPPQMVSQADYAPEPVFPPVSLLHDWCGKWFAKEAKG